MLARSRILVTTLVMLPLVLPLAVWLDLRDLTESLLRRQASDLNSAISSIRGYYAKHVVGRVLASAEGTMVLPNYREVPGAIPIPATLSLELARVISEGQSNISYRFVSDFPFRNRPLHALDRFEARALASLRQDPTLEQIEVTASLLTDSVRHIVPVVMEAACVTCHNSHPDSPKRDWRVGDVRGIQEVTITRPIVANIFSVRYLLVYLVVASASGFVFLVSQRRQATVIACMNQNLTAKNEFLASISKKLSHYLSPQIYEGIFNGHTEVAIHTQRKKLTIFFSDIVDFTGTTRRLQPEEIAALLNEYLTEMSRIALTHGGTIDKFIGDAMLVFFGDPESKGTAEDARACLEMAADMQRRLAELDAKWRRAGIERPLRVRMGINTGFCNVGNFGSAERMDYTVIGAEVNLAARLQSIAEPGRVVMSYETYALVRDMVAAHPLPLISDAGIGREVIPYAFEHWLDGAGNRSDRRIFSEHMVGLDLYLDTDMLESATVARVRSLLKTAIAGLEDHAKDREGPEEHGGRSA
jgi:class 3 adenylate cyclase